MNSDGDCADVSGFCRIAATTRMADENIRSRGRALLYPALARRLQAGTGRPDAHLLAMMPS